MDGHHVVVDISSDEDVGFDWPATDGCDSDIDWTELFQKLEKDSGDSRNPEKGYESDDVVVVKEVFAKPKRRKSSSGVANLSAQHREEDDDDCVILDGDPDKPVVEDKSSGYESDDLVIVSEKGQVACRDYPHPRHLCVQFPFGSTLHSEHCNLCHCYACDSPAPCGNWGNGISVADHCHATEKEELWKSERKRIKQGGNPFLKNEILFPVLPPMPSCVRLGQTPILPQQSVTYDRPNIIRNQKHYNQLYQQPIIPCSNNLQKGRVSNLSPHAATSSIILKRPRQDVNLLHPDQYSSEMNASKRISAGPTPSQGEVTLAQLYGQPIDQANSNPHCDTSHHNQSFTVPPTEEQSWNGSVDCLWEHF